MKRQCDFLVNSVIGSIFSQKILFVIDQNKTRTSTICQDVRVLFWSTTNKIYWEIILLITLLTKKSHCRFM